MNLLLHKTGRLIVATQILVLIMYPLSIWGMLLVIMLSGVLIALIERHVRTLMRAVKVLRWLVLPIIAVHGLATPGEILLGGAHVHLTREGLLQGCYLALHLVQFYFAGLCVGRFWPASQWLHAIARLPGVGSRVYPYLVLLFPLRASILQVLRGLQESRCGRKGWQVWPYLLESGISRSLWLGRRHAEALWLRWGRQAEVWSGSRETVPALPAAWWWLFVISFLAVGWYT
ncbi:MAG: hypothetical protein D6703_06015 [Zetaproteobacteria bacterium]|nr:MAG: hypothetical protein D6703_06015 [Zetaproteobacteria bacterium]